MKIHFIAGSDRFYDPCTFYRVTQPCHWINRLKLATASWSGMGVPDLDTDEAGKADVVVYQRPTGHAIDEKGGNITRYDAMITHMRNLKKMGKLIVVEHDDDIFSLSSSKASRRSYWGDPKVIAGARTMIEEAHLVTVTTDYFKKEWSHLNKNIEVLPNCVKFHGGDDHEYAKLPGSEEPTIDKVQKYFKDKNPIDLIKIGFIGSKSHDIDLKFIYAPLRTILKKWAGTVKVIFFGLKPVDNDLANHPYVEWSAQTVPPSQFRKAIFGFLDIGLVPLRNIPLNRAKSNLKWLDYSLAGTATICSDVGSYKELIHGVEVLKFYDYESCIEQIEELIKNPNMRKDLVMSSLKKIDRNFTIEKQAQKWVETYEKYRGRL